MIGATILLSVLAFLILAILAIWIYSIIGEFRYGDKFLALFSLIGLIFVVMVTTGSVLWELGI